MIKRLIFGLCLVPTLALSQTPTPAIFYVGSHPIGGGQTKAIRSQDLAALCDTKIAYYVTYSSTPSRPYTGGRATSPTGTSGFCQFRWVDQPAPASEISAGPWSKTVCTSAKPYFDPEIGCVAVPPVTPPPDTCADKNKFVRKWSYGSAVPPFSMPACFSGCAIAIDQVLVCRKEGGTTTYCMFEVHRTGAVCAAPEPPTTPSSGEGATPEDKTNPKTEMPPTKSGDPEGKCPAGSVQGGVDRSGIPICIGTGTNPPTAPTPKPSTETTKTEAQPDGSTKTTTTKTTTNADGSTTTNTTITIKQPDGSTTTNTGTSTGTKPDGTDGVADKPPEDDKYDLCKQNPMLAMCRNSSVSGSCGEITCQGDAIQCATLRAAAAMQCAQDADKKALEASPLTTLGGAALAGNDPLKDSLPTPAGASVVNMPGSVDAEGWLGGGSCFADKSITVQGHVITIPLSQSCDILLVLRYALMVVASLVSFRIVSGAVLT